MITVSITEEKEVVGAHNITVVADALFSETDFSGTDYLILPGGMPGAQHLNDHKGLTQLITEFNSKGKQIAAICAAPMILGELGILEGKKATCYPGFEDKLRGADVTDQGVATDKHVTTGKGPGLVFDFALTLVEQIAGKDKRQEVEQGLLL